MVHGEAGHVQRDRCWPNPRSAGDSATLAPLQEGVVPPAVRMALEPHNLTESGLGGPGTPWTSHRSPTSSSTDARRPCSPPQRSFPSCPTTVPGPEESRAFARYNCRTHRTDYGRAAGARKRRSVSRCRACSQPAAQGRGEESQHGWEEGGDWGRELEEGRRRGGRSDPRVDGRCALWKSGPATLTFYSPGPQLLPPPHRHRPSPGTRCLGSWRFWEGYL